MDDLAGGVGARGDGYERHADAVADAVTAGKSAEGLLDGMAPASAAVQRKEAGAAVRRVEVNDTIKDGPYEWTSAYDVAFDESAKECNIAVRVKLTPEDTTVTAEDVKKIKDFAEAQFEKYWDNKFTITDKTTNTKYKLRVSLAFVDAKQHVAVTLHAGQGRDDSENWYVDQIDNITLAHELGHQLGLKDEDVDSSVPGRADDAKAGVKIAVGIEGFRTGRIHLRVQANGDVKVEPRRSGAVRDWTVRWAPDRLAELGAALARDGFCAIAPVDGKRKPGDVPVMLELARSGDHVCGADVWHDDRYANKGLDDIIKRFDAAVSEITGGELPFGKPRP